MRKLKTIKVFLYGERMKDIYPHATRWQVFKYNVAQLARKVAFVLAFTGLVVGTALTYRELVPKIAHAEKEVIVEVSKKSAVMERIAKCESGGTHMKNGKVIFNKNTNGSIDVGKYQINTIWLPKLAELGLDVNKEEDNEKMAYYLYENFGTEPWYSSKSCWNK